MKKTKFKFQIKKCKRLAVSCQGFSLVELLVVVVIIGVISAGSYVGYQSIRNKASNEKMLTDIIALANALEEYKRDHNGQFPIPQPDPNSPIPQNVLCFYKDATYAHDCNQAAFVQGMIDNSILSQRYLRQVPTDPHTGSRYAYGVTSDGKYFQVAGVYRRDDGAYEARTAGNLIKGFELPSVIRAYDGPNFVVNKSTNLPYHPDHLTLIGKLRDIKGSVFIGSALADETSNNIVTNGDVVKTNGGSSVDIYFSDGSVTQLDENTTLEMSSLSVDENDEDSIITTIKLKLTSGKVWSKVARLAQGSTMEIESAGTIAGVRGTEFGIDDKGEVKVLSGEVAYGNISVNGGKKLAPGANATANLLAQDQQSIVNNYYKDLPLHTGIEPYLISAKGTSATAGKIQVRNVNHYVNEVNATLNISGRKIITNRLAVYDMSQNPAVFIKSSNDISSETINPYEIADLPLSKPLGFRFENCENLPMINNQVDTSKECTTILETSAYNRAEISLEQNTDLDEANLNPNINVQSKPELSLQIPSIVTVGQGKFTMKVLLKNGVIDTTSPAVTATVGATSCTPAGNYNFSSGNSEFDIEITTQSTGSCDLNISLKDDQGMSFSKAISIQIAQGSSQLTLKRPAEGAKLNIQGQTIQLAWEGPANAQYNVYLIDPSNKSTTLATNTGNTSVTTTAGLLATTGTYKWKVEIVGTSDALNPTFIVVANQSSDAEFSLTDQSGIQLMSTTESQKQLYIQSLPANNNLIYKILLSKQPPVGSNLTYDWAGSNPPVAANGQEINIDTTGMLPGQSKTGRVQLTLRDNNTIVGDHLKNFTVTYLPQLTSISFITNPITATVGGNPVNIPQITAVPTNATIKLSDCDNVRSINKQGALTQTTTGYVYQANANATLNQDKVACEISVGKVINGYKVVNLASPTAQYLVADLTVSITGAQPPALPPAQIACNDAIAAGKTAYYDNTNTNTSLHVCWVLGKAGDSCKTTCESIQSGAGNLSCTTGGWNADANVCSKFNATLSGTTYSFDYAPYINNQDCNLRDTVNASTQNCTSIANVFGTNYPRLCQCQ